MVFPKALTFMFRSIKTDYENSDSQNSEKMNKKHKFSQPLSYNSVICNNFFLNYNKTICRREGFVLYFFVVKV